MEKQKLAKQKKYVLSYITVLKKQFFLDGWEVKIDFFNDADGKKAAECTPDWRYRRATVAIYPPFWTLPDDERRGCLKHEFVHILLSQLLLIISGLKNGGMVTEDEISGAHEHVTTWFESIIETR